MSHQPLDRVKSDGSRVPVNDYGVEFGVARLDLKSLRFNIWILEAVPNKESRSINIQRYAEA